MSTYTLPDVSSRPLLRFSAFRSRPLVRSRPSSLTDRPLCLPACPPSFLHSLQLPYAYDALEPYISKEIMTLHHTKHHQTCQLRSRDALFSLRRCRFKVR